MEFTSPRILKADNSWLIFVSSLLAVVVGPGSLVAQPQPGAAEPAKPVFVDGQAQVVPAFKDPQIWIRQRLWVETTFDSDGDGKHDRMHVDVTRPAQTETEGLKVPVIYESSPYFSGVGGNSPNVFWDPKHELGAEPPKHEFPEPIPYQSDKEMISNSLVNEWVPRGFAVVHSEAPGTGLSQGCPTVGGDPECLAPKAVIDWLNGRAKGYTAPDGEEEVKADWCTGKVGMIGTSYNGTIPLAAATTGVEGLAAIVPVAPNTSYYHYYRSHGLVRHPGGYMGEDVDVLYDFIKSGNPDLRDDCDAKYRDKEMIENIDRQTGDYNEYWAERDLLRRIDGVKAATLMAHAFNDWNVMPEHSVRIYEALKAKGIPVQSYFHQGGHGGDPPLKQVNKWFTRYLHEVENGVEGEPKAWIVREDSRRNKPTAYPDYPHPEAQPVQLFPTGDGSQQGELSRAAISEATIQKLTDDVNFTGQALATAPHSPNRLLFLTPTLTEDLHLSGTARLKIKLAANKPAANLSVWLVALPWQEGGKITDNIITRGWADPQNHKSLEHSEPLVPGQFYDLDFTLQPDDQVIPKGEQIALVIFSSDRDFTLWPEPGTELSVELAGTELTLPVVGGAAAWDKATGK
jgi:X-Pro dipeptidyl-peptidase